LLAVLPGLFWSAPPDTAAALRKAGIESFSAPNRRIDAWKNQPGFTVTPVSENELKARIQLTPPGIDRKVMVASATSAPWVDANGWRFRRSPGKEFTSEVPQGRAALAAAEAYAYDAKAIFWIQPVDLDAFGDMLRFLRSIPDRDLPEFADFGFIDDGSENAAEILNLLTRRNLLYKVVRAADPQLKLNFPTTSDDPHLFAAKVREKLTDTQRSLRVYGSEVVLCRLLGNGNDARVHLINYGHNRIDGIRLRVRGTYKRGKIYTMTPEEQPQDWTTVDGFTEFSIPELGTYAVVDLFR
jgi:hypothetical protein